jgi:hypothetical protein
MDQTPILLASCLVAPVVWELDADIEHALHTEPAPLQCPVRRQHVPSAGRDQLIYWAHTSPSSGHPRIGQTLPCLTGKYWWPTLAKDVRVYVSSFFSSYLTGQHHDPGCCGSFLQVLSSPPSARSPYVPTDCGGPVYTLLPALLGV